MAELYKQLVMRHYKHPLNKGELIGPSKKFKGANPFCGDSLEISLKLNTKGKIIDVAWQGQGCAISLAAASVFSEKIKGKTLKQIYKLTSDDFIKELDIELSPTRRKCALLPLFTIKEDDV